jgi:2-polyprenyl-6-methoxyphenol hydroxylase-like FAD-dependent oxidoreductase
VGEALSPGVSELLEYLQIQNALDLSLPQRSTSARILWGRREPELAPPQHQLGVVVDRGEFDGRLLAAVRSAGGRIFQPAQPRKIAGEAGAWEVSISGLDGATVVRARLILDARGRGGRIRTRVPTAPATVALWTLTRSAIAQPDTHLEATEHGWLWGTRLPCGRYRLMAFVAPETIKGCGKENVLRDMVGRSALFTRTEFAAPVQSCSATSYIDQDAWKPGTLKLGDAALAIDPLSSSGIEKAMRIALQSAIAANTILRDSTATGAAQEFYESSLLSAAAAHAVWTRDFYARAWPGEEFPFWRTRSRAMPAYGGEPAFAARVRQAIQQQLVKRDADLTTSTNDKRLGPIAVSELLDRPVRLSAALEFVQVPCVVDDFIEPRLAVVHAALSRPLAFLGGVELVPLLKAVPRAESLGHLMALWSPRLPPAMSARLVGWLLLRGLLGTGDARCSDFKHGLGATDARTPQERKPQTVDWMRDAINTRDSVTKDTTPLGSVNN